MCDIDDRVVLNQKREGENRSRYDDSIATKRVGKYSPLEYAYNIYIYTKTVYQQRVNIMTSSSTAQVLSTDVAIVSSSDEAVHSTTTSE